MIPGEFPTWGTFWILGDNEWGHCECQAPKQTITNRGEVFIVGGWKQWTVAIGVLLKLRCMVCIPGRVIWDLIDRQANVSGESTWAPCFFYANGKSKPLEKLTCPRKGGTPKYRFPHCQACFPKPDNYFHSPVIESLNTANAVVSHSIFLIAKLIEGIIGKSYNAKKKNNSEKSCCRGEQLRGGHKASHLNSNGQC